MMRAGVLVVAFAAVAQAATAQRGSRLWQPDERVVITDFSTVEAVAATDVVLYVVTPRGIGMYDRRFNRWEPPVTRLDGYPLVRAFAALVDPIDESLWIAADVGLIHYQPRLRLLETIPVAGGVREIAVDERDVFAGFYLRAGRTWEFLPRGGIVTRPARQLPRADRQLRTVTVPELEKQYPALVSMRASQLIDDRLRQYRFSAATEVRRTNEVFLGTDGYGVFRLDLLTMSFERLPFGLLAPAAASVAVGEEGVWVGSGGGSARSGITFVSRDFQEFAYDEGRAVTGLGSVVVRDIMIRGRDVWAATDGGVVQLGPGGPVNRLTASRGLASDRTAALAEGAQGVWVGTGLGLAYVSDDGVVERVGSSGVVTVTALAAQGDTVWVGSRQGLGVSSVGMTRVVVPPEVRDVAELSDETVALAIADGTVIAATSEIVAWRRPGGGWQVDGVPGVRLGALTALAADSAGVWVAGDRGIGRFAYESRDYVFLDTPGDFPGRVRDIAVDDTYLWVATDGGLTRFRRTAVVP